MNHETLRRQDKVLVARKPRGVRRKDRGKFAPWLYPAKNGSGVSG